MDLRKVFDQTVRDLKREVNKKVLKVPEIEQKVLDATSNEPWGPHGTAMSEIAQATRNFNDYQMIMTVLWKRLADSGRNWRHVYKGLTLFDFLVAHGADRVIDELKEHIYQIQGLVDFQYVEPNGKDQGVNVRKKAQALVSLVNDKEKIREVRQKAATNRDKYQGYSSSGGIFKPSSYSSTGSRGFSDWDDDRNGGARNGGDKYDDEDRYTSSRDYQSKDNDRYRDDWRDDHDDDVKNSRSTEPPSYETSQKKPSNQVSTVDDDDEDDFNPRASGKQKSAPAPAPAPEIDLLGDFFSTPIPTTTTTTPDPFASPDFATKPQSTSSNLFASDSFANDFGAFTSAEPAKTPITTDFFAAAEPAKTSSSETDLFAAKATSSPTDFFAADPFAPISSKDNLSSLNSFDAFGNLSPAPTSTPAPAPAPISAPASTSASSIAPPPAFQPKSSVWADSLGLIDLNISAPKDTISTDFDWSGDHKQQVPSGGFKPMGSGSGLGIAGASGLSAPPPPPNIAADPFGFGSSTNTYFGTMDRNTSVQNDPFASLR